MKNNYVDKKELLDEIIKSQQQGKMTERLAELCMLMGNHLLTSQRFLHYSPELKEDMLSLGCLYVVRYLLKNFDPSKNTSPFAYITSIFVSGFQQTLNKHYKQIEFERELTELFSEYMTEEKEDDYEE